VQKPITNFGKSSCGRIVRTLEIFQGTHVYWAHRAVLFAIAQLSCCSTLTVLYCCWWWWWWWWL